MQCKTPLIIVIASALINLNCDNPATPGDRGTLRISLTDAPGDFEAVNITFSEVSANINDKWIVLSSETQTINLLEFTNGRTVEIGSADVPVGDYAQIRLKIADAEVQVNGEVHPMTVPSGAETGLKLVTEFTIVEGGTVELIVDFDAQRSVVCLGPPNAAFGYILKPTVRVIANSLTGSISGVVTNSENAPVAYAIAAGDTVTSTPIDPATGDFMLAFLPPEVYTVSVVDLLEHSFEANAVSVTAGQQTSLGQIALE